MADGRRRTDHDSRILAIEAAYNIRDLGGLPTVGGRRTAFGRLYRSEFLASPASHGELGIRVLQLKSVVDLRRTSEIAHEQVPWDAYGVRLFHCPLRLTKGTSSWEASYHRYLLDGAAGFVKAIRVLADPENQPALFHCAAGKDRTGVVAAVLLDLAGVERAEISHDYALTADGIDAVITRLAGQGPYRPALAGTAPADHVPVTNTMDAFLSWLSDVCGGSEKWLLKNGVSVSEIAGYRSVMVVD